LVILPNPRDYITVQVYFYPVPVFRGLAAFRPDKAGKIGSAEVSVTPPCVQNTRNLSADYADLRGSDSSLTPR
jgi:hypothetical protein